MYVRMMHDRTSKLPYSIHTADAIYSQPNLHVQFQTNCSKGVDHDKATQFGTNELTLASMESRGFQIGTYYNSASISLSSSSFQPIQPSCDDSNHDDPISSHSSMSYTIDQLRSMIRGICRGLNQPDVMPERSTASGTIRTKSSRLRDFMVQLCLHAGYTAHFEPITTPSSTASSTIIGWSVHWSNAIESSSPVLSIGKDCSVYTVDGRVWCVTVPTDEQLIMFRRVQKDAHTGTLIEAASRPIVVGNTRFTGISLKLIGKFTHQLLMTLAYLSCKERGEERIIHCDLKPENILLVNSKKSKIKVIDLGSACFAHQKVYTYIQSRFYRAAEVILGVGYNAAIDVWSLGCICFELSSGTPLFDGPDEHDQIIRYVDLLGIPPSYMIERSKKGTKFFEPILHPPSQQSSGPPHSPATEWQLRDPLLVPNASSAAAATYMRLFHGRANRQDAHLTPKEKLQRRLSPKYQDTPIWNAFVDLIMRMLDWDPKTRIKPAHALNHEFFVLMKHQTEQAMKAAEAAKSTPPTPAQTVESTPSTTNATSKSIWSALDSNPAAATAAPVSTAQSLPSTIPSATTAPFARQLPVESSADVAASAVSVAAPTATTDSSDTRMVDVAPSIGTTTQPPVETTSSDMQIDTVSSVPPTPAATSQAANVSVPSSALADSTASASMEVDDVATPSQPARPPQPTSTVAHSTPSSTRKRPSVSSPRSPTSVQGTPKTRAAAAAAAKARNIFDSEIEHMALPQNAYQSPSLKPMNRSMVTRRHTIAQQMGSSQAGPIPGSVLPPRRGSENLHAQSSLVGAPPFSLGQRDGVLTRAQKIALSTPPSGPSTAPTNSPHMNGNSASLLGRQLASDPLALHLEEPSKPSSASRSASFSASGSPPMGPESTPSTPMTGLALFASPQTLRHYATRYSKRHQALVASTASEKDKEKDVSEASDPDPDSSSVVRRVTRRRSALQSTESNESNDSAASNERGVVYPTVDAPVPVRMGKGGKHQENQTMNQQSQQQSNDTASPPTSTGKKKTNGTRYRSQR